jgi:DNA polymerase-1
MLDIYKNKGDLHTETAKTILGLNSKEWESLDKTLRKEKRTDAKAANFGLIYGMSAESFVDYAFSTYDLKLTLSQAKKYRDTFFKKYSRLLLWHDLTVKMLRKQKYVETLFGRKRHLPNIDSPDDLKRSDAERQGINSPIQGTAGQLTLLSLAVADRRFYYDRDKFWFVNSVHDSSLSLIKEEYVDEMVPKLKKVFENPLIDEYFGFELGVETPVDVETGDNWGEMQEYKI